MKLIDAFKITAQRVKEYVDSKHVELDNAIETNGMGWTDEDETVHKIDEKYLPIYDGGVE